MSDQPEAAPQPSQSTIISVQKREINALNDNRIYLMSMMEEIKVEANTEIGRLNGVISQIMNKAAEDAAALPDKDLEVSDVPVQADETPAP